MQNNDIKLIRDFHHRYKKISATSSYALVYDTLALIREFILGREISISIGKPTYENIEDLRPGNIPLWIATPQMGRTQNLFHQMFGNIGFAKRAGIEMMLKAIAEMPVEAISFYATDDEALSAKKNPHRFYDIVNVSDIVITGGLIARHQLLQSPFTQGYYVAYMVVARENGLTFSSREKQLFALFFDIFLEDLRNKISCSEHCPFLPYLTCETMNGKTKIEAIFDTGAVFKPRELATIKACFDLKQRQQAVTRSAVAIYLHLQDRNDYTVAEFKKAVDKLDYDLKKIKEHLLRNFYSQDTSDNYNRLQKEIELEHLTEVFKLYAYFGFYPDVQEGGKERFISYLSNRLDKYR